MKKLKTLLKFFIVYQMIIVSMSPVFAQGYGSALTFQGTDQFLLHSGAGRAMGGISMGVSGDLGVMFYNPAALHSLKSIQLSVGGQLSSYDIDQEQNYAPVRYYPNLSLLLEGLTAYIPDPDTLLPGFTAMDTVQRPFDDIEPNWSKSESQTVPLQALLAVPLSLGTVKVVAGVGAVNYADLSHYYQNNNVLSPGILSQRPLPTLRPTDDNPVEVKWSQSVQSREGTIHGYGFALAGSIEKYNLTLGISGMLLQGSSDDYEQEVARGNMTFFSNAFRLDSTYSRITKTGVSDYSGQEFTLSSILSGRFVSLGVTVKLPVTITRSYSMQISTDSTGVPSYSSVQGEDKLKIPWRGIIGLSIAPRENITIGMEYEHRPYGSVKYIDPDGTEANPWLGASLFRGGLEFRMKPWLALRGGMRGEAEVFESEGSQIIGEPVKYTIYSAGFGLALWGINLDMVYEYSNRKYEDTWASAISKNSEPRNTVVAQLSYRIPWIPKSGVSD
jgi:opacity protein-like surface antigen